MTRCALLLLVLAACSADKARAERGEYFCVVGAPGKHPVGMCSVSEDSCRSKIAAAPGAALECRAVTTLAYELRWTGPYGPMEAWYVDETTCLRDAREFWKTDAPCVAAPWSGTGRRAH